MSRQPERRLRRERGAGSASDGRPPGPQDRECVLFMATKVGIPRGPLSLFPSGCLAQALPPLLPLCPRLSHASGHAVLSVQAGLPLVCWRTPTPPSEPRARRRLPGGRPDVPPRRLPAAHLLPRVHGAATTPTASSYFPTRPLPPASRYQPCGARIIRVAGTPHVGGASVQRAGRPAGWHWLRASGVLRAVCALGPVARGPGAVGPDVLTNSL